MLLQNRPFWTKYYHFLGPFSSTSANFGQLYPPSLSPSIQTSNSLYKAQKITIQENKVITLTHQRSLVVVINSQLHSASFLFPNLISLTLLYSLPKSFLYFFFFFPLKPLLCSSKYYYGMNSKFFIKSNINIFKMSLLTQFCNLPSCKPIYVVHPTPT